DGATRSYFVVPHARVDQGQGQIGQQHAHQQKSADEHDVGHDEVDVLVEHGVVHETADARVRKHDLEDERPREQIGQQVGAARDERVHGVAERVLEPDTALVDAARTQRRHVRLTQLVKHGGADETERAAQTAQKGAQKRQKDMIQVRESKADGAV